MPRESVDTRAERLLLEHRVTVVHLVDDVVTADVRGDGSAVHRVTHEPGRGWACTCEAGQFRRRCAHRAAVERVVITRRPS